MKEKLLLLLVVFIFYQTAQSQNSPQDCPNAIPVCVPEYDTDESYTGKGDDPYEIDPSLSCLKSGERNNVWYVINVRSPGKLGFLLTPKNLSDDYDWAVFNLTYANCEDIRLDGSLEVNCNYSQTAGATGPDGRSTETHQDNDGTPFNAMINVNVGETYVICISNYSETQFGYVLDFDISTADIYDDIAPWLMSVDVPQCGGESFVLRFSENINCSTVDISDIELTGPGGPYTVTAFESDNCNQGGKYDREFTVVVTPEMQISGNYTIRLVGAVTDLCGNEVSTQDEIIFSVQGLPINISSEESTICSGDSTQITVAPAGSPPYEYIWTDSSSLSCGDCAEPFAFPDQTTEYEVIVRDQNNCEDTAYITIEVLESPDLVLNHSSITNCSSHSIQLEATVQNMADVTYSWEPAEGLSATDIANPLASPDVNTVYTCTATSTTNGCSSTAEVVFTVIPTAKPEITLDGDPNKTEACTWNKPVLDAGDNDPITGKTYGDYIWHLDGQELFGETDRELAITESGMYMVYVTDADGCVGTDTLTVTVMESAEPDAYSIPADSICTGEECQLFAEITNGITNVEYQWLVTDGFIDAADIANPRAVVNADTKYIVEVTNLDNGCVSYDTVDLKVTAPIVFSLGGDREVCSGEEFLLEPDISSAGSTGHYKWEPLSIVRFPDAGDSSKALIRAIEDVTLKLTVTNDYGCSTEDEIQITVGELDLSFAVPDRAYESTKRDASLPVVLLSSQGTEQCLPDSIKVFMSIESAIFNPQRAVFKGADANFSKVLTADNSRWLVELSAGATGAEFADNSSIFEIFGDMILGDRESGSVSLDSVLWMPYLANPTLQSGTLSISNICRGDNFVRLIEQGYFQMLTPYPNPAKDFLTVNLLAAPVGGKINIRLTDLVGRTISSQEAEVEYSAEVSELEQIELLFETSHCKSGIYRITACYGTECISQQIVILK